MNPANYIKFSMLISSSVIQRSSSGESKTACMDQDGLFVTGRNTTGIYDIGLQFIRPENALFVKGLKMDKQKGRI
jgi:hypothetical protein